MYKGINLQLINAKSFTGHGGAPGLSCELKYNGKKIATYFDSANGGEPQVDPIAYEGEERQQQREAIEQLKKELKTLPKVKTEHFEFDYDIGLFVDELYQHMDFLKLAKKGLLFETKEKKIMISRFSMTLPALLKNGSPKQVVATLERMISEAQAKGHTILCQDYYISIGVKKEIFL